VLSCACERASVCMCTNVGVCMHACKHAFDQSVSRALLARVLARVLARELIHLRTRGGLGVFYSGSSW
jgi:hypothetical protein